MRRVVARELMDDPGVDARDLAANFVEIERANRWFGGLAPTVDAVLATPAATVLDVGCGSADVDRALVAAARRARRPLAVTALDLSPAVLAIARERSAGCGIAFVRGDALALPYGDGAFDVVTCNLALHHFEPPAATRVLRELRRVARFTAVVSDLARSRAAYVAALAFSRLLAKNRLTRHDGPLSVRRAYDAGELLALARDAGWRAPRVRATPFFRHVVTDGG